MCVCVWCAWPRVVGIWRLILFLWVCASVPRSMAHKLFCERWMCVHLSTSPSLCLSFFVSLCVRWSVCLFASVGFTDWNKRKVSLVHWSDSPCRRQEWMGCTCSGWWAILVTASVQIDIVQIDATCCCEVNLCFNLTLLKLFIDVSRDHGQAPSSAKHRSQQCGATGRFASSRSMMLHPDVKFRLHMWSCHKKKSSDRLEFRLRPKSHLLDKPLQICEKVPGGVWNGAVANQSTWVKHLGGHCSTALLAMPAAIQATGPELCRDLRQTQLQCKPRNHETTVVATTPIHKSWQVNRPGVCAAAPRRIFDAHGRHTAFGQAATIYICLGSIARQRDCPDSWGQFGRSCFFRCGFDFPAQHVISQIIWLLWDNMLEHWSILAW